MAAAETSGLLMLQRERLDAMLRFVLAGVLAAFAAAASAQTTLTLYGGARGGGDFEDASGNGNIFKLDSGAAVSASIDFPLDDGREGQVFYSYPAQRAARPGVRPAGAGVDQHQLPAHRRPRLLRRRCQERRRLCRRRARRHLLLAGLGGLSDEVRPSANVGVGWQWTLTRNVALRTELRGYLSLINANGGFFCSGGCVVSIRGRTLAQAEGMVGVSVGF